MLGYAAAVALAGVLLFTAAMLDAPASLAERAVALERGGVTLRDALRDLLGDPELEIGFAVGSGELVDDHGRPLGAALRGSRGNAGDGRRPAGGGRRPRAGSRSRTTAIRSAVIAAVGLAAERARLRAEVGRQADAVDASRRRLLLAEEEERRRLAERLERGPGAALAEVERLVHEARPGPSGPRRSRPRSTEPRQQLARVRPELDALVRGLGGVDRAGLVPALERLAVGLPVEVDLELAEVTVSPEVASALWFVCSESLANAVKHADARTVRVALAAETNGIVRTQRRGRRARRRGRWGIRARRPRRPGRSARRAAGGRVAAGRRDAGRRRAAAAGAARPAAQSP